MALITLQLTIPAGQSLSPPLEMPTHSRIMRIIAPDAWDPAAPITFAISPDNIVFRDLYRVNQAPDGRWIGYEVELTAVFPGTILLLPADAGSELGWMKIRSGTRMKPVNQVADRVFGMVMDS
jgi:hypothetical protein